MLMEACERSARGGLTAEDENRLGQLAQLFGVAETDRSTKEAAAKPRVLKAG